MAIQAIGARAISSAAMQAIGSKTINSAAIQAIGARAISSAAMQAIGSKTINSAAIQAIGSSAMQAIGSKIINSSAQGQGLNCTYRLQELICRIMTQLSRFSEQSRRTGDSLKKDYKLNTEKSAGIQEYIGKIGPAFGIAQAVFLGGHTALQQIDPEQFRPSLHTLGDLLSKLADGIPTAKDWYTCNMHAERARCDARSTLQQTEFANEGQKSGEGSNFQQELMSLLSAARNMLGSVTR